MGISGTTARSENTFLAGQKGLLINGSAFGNDWSNVIINLLYASLTTPLVCCHINFPRSLQWWRGHGQEAKAERWAGSHHKECEAIGPFLLPCAAPVVSGRDVRPERCNSSGTAVDACRDITTGVRWAEHAADGDVVCVLRALSGAPRAPRITAQRGLNSAPSIPATACHQRNYVETYSRSITCCTTPSNGSPGPTRLSNARRCSTTRRQRSTA